MAYAHPPTQNLTRDEVNDIMGRLQQEIEELTEQVGQPTGVVRDLSRGSIKPDPNPTSPLRVIPDLGRLNIKPDPDPIPNPTPPLNPPKPITRPRDVPILELHQLEGLEAAARLQIYFELIEQCSPDDGIRVQIAKSRLGSELAMLVHNCQAKGRCSIWKDLREFLRTEFAVDVNVDRAWQDLDDVQYDWAENPQSYIIRYICQYANLEIRFPTKSSQIGIDPSNESYGRDSQKSLGTD